MFEELAALPAVWHWSLASLFGLLVGSFLNVVIYRYPNRLKYEWTAQSYEWLNDKEYEESKPPALHFPPSQCSHCKTPIRFWQNIPVVSFLLLRGKCANCQKAIGLRYPLVELLTACLTGWVVYRFGWSPQAAFGVLLTWALISLSFIDFDHQLLPDDIVLPTLWLGLFLSLAPLFATPTSAIIGAIAGYLFLWSIFHLFRLATGKEGMGHGDFKLLSLFGAWLGWQYLPQIVLLSTVLGSIVGISLIVLRRSSAGSAIPFGPYIAMAGWLAMMYGSEINQMYLNYTGL